MAADCSDSLAAQILCCVPHNGLTHEESTLSLSTVHLITVLIGALFDSFVAHVLGETALFSHDCAFFSFYWEFPVSLCFLFPPGFLLLQTFGLIFTPEFGLNCLSDALPDNTAYINLERAQTPSCI